MRAMKRLIAIAMMVLLLVAPKMVSAETVSCTSGQYGGAVCGIQTSETVSHTVVETGSGDNQIVKLLISIAGAALVATGLYKMTYKNYFLG